MRFRNKSGKSGMAIRAVCLSDTGKVRAHNEDNFMFRGYYLPQNHQSMDDAYVLYQPLEGCMAYAVFDGMGGLRGGELASYTAAAQLAERCRELLPTKEGLTELVRCINREVYQAGCLQQYQEIGTTLSMLAFENDTVWVCNLGDSPIYCFRQGELMMLGKAHTNAEELKRMGITGRKPGLTQFLGISEEEVIVEPFISSMEAKQKDLYLICSDGLTDMVSEEEISELLSRKTDLPERAELLIQKALEHGGRDNVTVLLIEMGRESKQRTAGMAFLPRAGLAQREK